MSSNISFVSENQLTESRKRRQEEWEKTRKEDDPLEAPEEAYDSRTLYERLQEQKLKKQEVFDESRKLKNLIKGLDNDEIEFLQIIDNSKVEIENKKFQEELLAIEEYKREVSHLNDEDQERQLLEFKRELFKLHKNKSGDNNNQTKSKKSQAALLSGIIKRKPSPTEGGKTSKKLKSDSNEKEEATESSSSTETKVPNNNDEGSDEKRIKYNKDIPTIHCIGRLPGIGCYDDDSDSCNSDKESDESDCEDFTIFAPTKTTHAK